MAEKLTVRQMEFYRFVNREPGAASHRAPGGVTVKQVAEHFGVSGASAAAVLKRLLKAGAVTEDRSAKALVYRAV
jgi:DNA-binding MarR family transcriptional regulator